MEACKNRRDKHFSGAVVPTFLHRDGLNDLWRSLTAPKLCLFDVDCIFIHQLVGLLIGKSKTRWGNTAKRGDKLPSLFTLSGWPFFSLFIPTTCTSYAPDRTLSFPASYAFHSSWATAMCEPVQFCPRRKEFTAAPALLVSASFGALSCWGF